MDRELRRVLARHGATLGLWGSVVLFIYNFLLQSLNFSIPRLGLAITFVIVSLGYTLLALALETLSSVIERVKRLRYYALAMLVVLGIAIALHVAALYVIAYEQSQAALLAFIYIALFYIIEGLVVAKAFGLINAELELKDFKLAYYIALVGYVLLPIAGITSGYLGALLGFAHMVITLSFLFAIFGFISLKRAIR